MVLGIILVLLACLVAIGIGVIATKNIQKFDEDKHESFLG